MLSVLSSVELWIAVLTGGAAVKIIDYILPAILNRRSRDNQVVADEKEDLRHDIEYLRGQIDELRSEVKTLQAALQVVEREASMWESRYWRKKIELEKVIWQVRNFGEPNIQERVLDTLTGDTWEQEEEDDAEEEL